MATDPHLPDTPSASCPDPRALETERLYLALINSIDQGFCTIDVAFDADDRPIDYRFVDTSPSFARQTGIEHGADRWMREIAPDQDEHWFEIYGRVSLTGESARFEEQSTPLGRWWSVYAFRIEDRPRGRIGVLFNDITERKRTEERQAFLLALSDAIGALSDAVDITETVTWTTMRYFKADRCYYVEIDGDVATIRRDAYREGLRSVANVYSLREMPLFRSVSEAGRPIVVRDATTADAIDDSLKQLCASARIVSFVSVPVLKDARLVGNLSLTQCTARDWTEVEIELAKETAERTWAAVERAGAEEALARAHDELERRVEQRTSDLAQANAALQAEVRERRAAEAQIKGLFERLISIQEEERARIARDIHDQLGQHMTALRMSLEASARWVAGDQTRMEQAERTQQLAEELDRSIDFLTWELRPAALEHLGLPAALQRLVSSWSERFGVVAEFDASRTSGLRLPRDTEANLYRIVQEALHNIVKHAGASHVTVQLEHRHRQVVLVVEDNGRGFTVSDAVPPSDHRLGLVSMRERALLAGGVLEIESTPGQGTTIFVRILTDRVITDVRREPSGHDA